MLTKKALATALGAVMSVTLLTAVTAAPAGARATATRSTPGAASLTWSLCRLQYLLYHISSEALTMCCWADDAPAAYCSHLWGDSSPAAWSAPASPGRTG
ncbi:hypothetical protein [Nonomuraea sp. NPDC049309]|uniref:hypothetical protein n=1 Tax=Nonomuraea sp. NPDC049309 TaxID=3364350 RepID=UPI00371892FE